MHALRTIRPALFLAAMMVLAGCSFEASAPKRTPAPPTPEPPLSTLSATMTIPASRLASLLNNMTEYHIADLHDQPVKCGIGNCRLNLTASRTGPASVKAQGGALSIAMPFAVKAELGTSGLFSFLHAQGDGQGTALARSTLAISPGLALRAHTTGSVNLDNGHLKLGQVVTNIAQLWNDNQASLAAPLWRSVDKRVSALPLQPGVTALWTRLFTPIRIGKSPVSWLVLKPERLSVSQPEIANDAVGISLSVAARGRIIVQDQSPANPPSSLPKTSAMTARPDTFSFAVPFLLPYGRAAQLAMASLTKKPPQIAAMAVHLSQLEILPSGADVVVAAKFCADPRFDHFGWLASCGTIYLRGTPVFDPADQTVRIDKLHYDITSANPMVLAVQTLAGSALTQSLQSHLVFHEARDIGRLKDQVVSALAKPEGQEVSLSAQVQSFGEPSFTWTADGFLAQFSARGIVKTAVNF